MSSGPATPSRGSHSLPVAVTPLLGRESALEETERLLATTRLLTITGAGGSGKTRLAMELAHRVAANYERAVWVDLAAVAEGTLVAQQILDALGRRERPSDSDDGQLIVEALRETKHLLVLDNCEHVIDACAAIAGRVLQSSAATTILATTREALGIPGEQIWLIPPLSESGGIELFVERARAVHPGFTQADDRATIAHICRRLDGIPLAIELAAARAKVLPVEQIAERLDDAFSLLTSRSRAVARHRTIRETIDWSYRLLSPDEQKLLAVLSVFSGGFSIADASAVGGSGDVLADLSALVDKSLVVAAGGRYRLLETVRQFAADKLAESREREAMRERHARTFFTLVERSEPKIYAGAVDLAVLAMLDEEIENIRLALDWASEQPSRFELELRFLWALHWYWFARGHFHEARRRIGSARARMTADVDPLVRARLLVAAGNAAVWQGDWKALRPSIDEAVDILRPSNNLRALANALLLLGCAYAFAENDRQSAKEVFDFAEEVARRNGRNVALALTLYWSGIAAGLRGDRAAARRAFAETHRIGIEQRNLPAIGHGATMLALVDVQEKNYEAAIANLRAALDAHRETGDVWGLTQTIEGIGLLLLDIGDAEAGTRLIAGASAAWLALGARPGRSEAVEAEKTTRIRQALGDDRLRVVLASGAAMSYEEIVALAREQIGSISNPPPPLTAALRVRALGTLEIVRGDTRIEGTSQSGRAIELLLFLLSNPAGATKEEIGAALWPEADPSKLRNNFHVTVHRLRKLLGGAGWITADGEVYAVDRSGGVDFDAEVFERDVKAALRSGDIGTLEDALRLYRGDFASNAGHGEWIVALRERLRDLHHEALRVIGRERMASGAFRGAVEIYEKLIEADELDEQAYRNLMTCLARSGDAEAATRAYRRLARILRRELDAEPDPATTRLHERIVAEAESR